MHLNPTKKLKYSEIIFGSWGCFFWTNIYWTCICPDVVDRRKEIFSKKLFSFKHLKKHFSRANFSARDFVCPWFSLTYDFLMVLKEIFKRSFHGVCQLNRFDYIYIQKKMKHKELLTTFWKHAKLFRYSRSEKYKTW